ncbi:MAG: hypothetical protein WAM24_18455 [Ignavibacteriaceae bacterium]
MMLFEKYNSELFLKIFLPLLIFVILFFSENTFPQTVKRNYIGGNFGGSDFHLLDLRASPLIFGSIGITPSLQYFYRGDKSLHYIDISYFSDNLKTSAENFNTDNQKGRIRYSYLHTVTSFLLFQQNFDLYLGGSASTFLCHSDYYYAWIPPGYSRAMESWYWNSSLDITAQIEFKPGGREFFSLRLFIPVVSNISRPKYSPSGDYNYIDNDWKFKMFGKTEFIPHNFSLNTILAYQRPLIWNFNFQVSYEFYYSAYNKPKDVNMYMNNFSGGLFFCF